MTVKPTINKIDWANTEPIGTNVIEPTTRKSTGFQKIGGIPEKALYEEFNFMLKSLTEWVEFFDSSSPVKRGLETFIDPGDTDHDITTRVGEIKSNADNGGLFATTEITKQGDATWADGNDTGGVASGDFPVSVDTWLHFFIIGKPTGEINYGWSSDVDATSLLADAAVISAGYTRFARIASHLFDGSSNITGYTQNGDNFVWDVRVVALTTTTPSQTRVSITIPTPPDIDVIAHFRSRLENDGFDNVNFFGLGEPDTAAGANTSDLGTRQTLGQHAQVQFQKRVNNSIIDYRATSAGTVTNFSVVVFSYRDFVEVIA